MQNLGEVKTWWNHYDLRLSSGEQEKEEGAVVRERNELATKNICSSVTPTLEPGRDTPLSPVGRIRTDGPSMDVSFEQIPKGNAFTGTAPKSEEPHITGIGQLGQAGAQRRHC